MNQLKSYLVALHNGQPVPLSYLQSQYGNWMVDTEIRFHEGRWLKGYQNCLSSQDFDLGSCRCVSHPARAEVTISRKQMLELLREKVKQDLAEQNACQEEIDWLNRAISTLAD